MNRRLSIILAVLCAVVLLLPTSVTVAYFTSEQAAPQTTSGTGKWCAVRSPEAQANVYRLADFPDVGAGSRMMIVPVVHNDEFGELSALGNELEAYGMLGARLWSCTSENLPTDSFVKVTAWSNDDADASSMTWLSPRNSGFAGQRLDPSVGYGLEIANLHRMGDEQMNGNPVISSSRARYSWLVSSGRSKSSRTARPACPDRQCTMNLHPIPTIADAFPVYYDSVGTPLNYGHMTANRYRFEDSQFRRSPDNTWLDRYTGSAPPFDSTNGPTSTDGRQVQWVVLEWYGNTTPSDDLVIEVLLQ